MQKKLTEYEQNIEAQKGALAEAEAFRQRAVKAKEKLDKKKATRGQDQTKEALLRLERHHNKIELEEMEARHKLEEAQKAVLRAKHMTKFRGFSMNATDERYKKQTRRLQGAMKQRQNKGKAKLAEKLTAKAELDAEIEEALKKKMVKRQRLKEHHRRLAKSKLVGEDSELEKKLAAEEEKRRKAQEKLREDHHKALKALSSEEEEGDEGEVVESSEEDF